MDELLLRRRMLNMFRDEYIVFADPNVEQICATNWGDGTKITKNQAAAVTSLGNKFQGNTTITSFDELSYFKSLRTLQNNEFNGCTALTSISIPDAVTSVGTSAFQNCTGLTGDLELSQNVTTVGTKAFYNCTNLNSLTIPSSVTQISTETITGAAKNGTVHVCGNVKSTGGYQYFRSRHIIIDGNFSGYNTMELDVELVESIRIGGNFTKMGGTFMNYSGKAITKFVELMGTATNYFMRPNMGWAGGGILHLGYNGIAMTPSVAGAGNGYLSKIYVGDGSSQAADQAVLDQYLANSSWASYSSKLDLWYNYNGEYKNS